MSNPYTPQADSLAAKIITWLNDTNAACITTAEVVQQFGVPVNNLSASLKIAIKHGALQKVIYQNRTAYALGDGVGQAEQPRKRKAAAPAPEATTNPEALTLTRWSDGDMFAQGLGVTDDGQVRFTQAQLQQIINFACRPHVTVPVLNSF